MKLPINDRIGLALIAMMTAAILAGVTSIAFQTWRNTHPGGTLAEFITEGPT